MGRNLVSVAVVVLIGVAGVSTSALAQGTVSDGAQPDLRSAGPGSSAGRASGEGNRSGVGGPGQVEPRSGAVVSPSLGDVNRGMSGYYRNRTGMTPPSGRGGGWSGGNRGAGGRSGGGRW